MVWDVIIVGAGVVGALTARELARHELRVLVIEAEPDAAMGATKSNSAIVHGGFAEGPETLRGRLGAAGRRLFPALEDELGFGFRPIGSLVLSFSDDDAPLRRLFDRGRANGLADLELWSGDRIREHEPHVNPDVKAGLWCAGAGICSPWDLAYAALENAVAHGVEFLPRQKVVRVEGPLAGKGRWRLSTADRAFEARFVINAAGFGGGALDALAGLSDSTISPRTGEYVIFAQGTGALVNSVLFQVPGPLGKGVLVAPTYFGNLLVGPDARNEDAAAPGLRDTHADRLAALLSQAAHVVGGIDMKKAIRSFTGVRAAARSGDFLVGAADPARLPGWHRAVGIQSPGLTASPALAKLLVEGLAADGLELRPRADFDGARRSKPAHLLRTSWLPFAEADAATRLPEGDPGRMVCRCEQVRERDLAAAYARELPVTTVDALKRRTRAGMGWCQGQFCRPRVAAWLERRAGAEAVLEDDVTRSGLHRVAGKELRSVLSATDSRDLRD